MATGTRIRQDFIEGTLISNLSTSATAMESDGLADLTVIDNATNNEYAAAVIGDEVVHVITHNSAATTAEIQRGQEGTTAAAHDAGAAWHHGPTEDDFAALVPGAGVAGVRAYKSADQALANVTFEAITFDVEVYDPDGWHDNATNPSRFTVPAGTPDTIYAVRGKMELGTNTGTEIQMRLYKNAASPYGATGLIDRAANKPGTKFSDVFFVSLSAGDYIELVAYQDSGGSSTILGSDEFETNISIEPLRTV